MKMSYNQVAKKNHQVAVQVKERVQNRLRVSTTHARELFVCNFESISIQANDAHERECDEAKLSALYSATVLRERMRRWPEGVLCFAAAARSAKRKITINTATHKQLVQQLREVRELREKAHTEPSLSNSGQQQFMAALLINVVECARLAANRNRMGQQQAEATAGQKENEWIRSIDLVCSVLYHLVRR